MTAHSTNVRIRQPGEEKSRRRYSGQNFGLFADITGLGPISALPRKSDIHQRSGKSAARRQEPLTRALRTTSWSYETGSQIEAVVRAHQRYEKASQTEDCQDLPGDLDIRGSIGNARKSLNQ